MPEVILEDEAPEIPGIRRTKLKRDVDEKADELRERLTLPPVPAFEMNDRQWEEYARLLTPDMWTQISSMYLYRLYPKIILQLVDPTNKYKNIDKLNRIANVREHILKLHGGGKYKLDISKNKKKGEERICQVYVDIPITEADPILDYRTLDLSSADNTGYITSLKARGILDDRGNPSVHNQPQQGQAITGQDMVGMFREFMGMFAKMKAEDQANVAAKLNESGGLGNQIGAILLEKMKQDSPATLVTGMSGMLSAAKEIMGERRDNGNTEFLKILLEQQRSTTEMMTKHSEQMLSLVKEMKTPKGGESSILDSVDSAMSIMERLDSLRGGGGNRGIGDYILEGAEKIGIPLLSHITRIYEITKLGKAVTQAPAPTPNPQPTVAPSGRQITGMEAARNAAKAEQGKVPPKPEPNGVEALTPDIVEDQEMIQLMQVLQGTGGILVQYMNDDRSGADLALWVIEGYKKVTYQMIANAGEEKLFNAIRNFPELWQQLERFGEPAVRTFVHEFCHYEEFLEPEEVIEEEEPKGRGRNKK
jgi:hypothetical protein